MRWRSGDSQQDELQAYTFADLPYVRNYQLGKLSAAKAPYPNLAPQAMLAATEQGWTTSNPTTTGRPSLLPGRCSLNNDRTGYIEPCWPCWHVLSSQNRSMCYQPMAGFQVALPQ